MANLIEKIIKSGLTGRGGAGFPTGKKWEAVKNAPGKKKFVIANGSEKTAGCWKIIRKKLLQVSSWRSKHCRRRKPLFICGKIIAKNIGKICRK